MKTLNVVNTLYSSCIQYLSSKSVQWQSIGYDVCHGWKLDRNLRSNKTWKKSECFSVFYNLTGYVGSHYINTTVFHWLNVYSPKCTPQDINYHLKGKVSHFKRKPLHMQPTKWHVLLPAKMQEDTGKPMKSALCILQHAKTHLMMKWRQKVKNQAHRLAYKTIVVIELCWFEGISLLVLFSRKFHFIENH